ncbi:hypothetical protein AB4098_15660 [Vibrio cyclitrophicus]
MSDKSKNKPLPSFIEERLNFYIQDLITQNESQKHLVLGSHPSHDAVVMQSNDYLSLSHNEQIQKAHRDAISQHEQEVIRLEKTLEVIKASDDKRDTLFKRAKALTTGLKRIGFNIRSESQIVALECGSESNTERVRDFLEERDVFGAVFCRPATGRNKNIIRFSINADMTPRDIDHVLTACQEAFNHPDLEFV